MSDEKHAKSYLRSVRSSLRVPRAQRRRALEEIASHLDEGAGTHVRSGATRAQAIAMVIDELGSPEAVAAAFNDEGRQAPEITGISRWLPMLLPMVLFAFAVGSLVWSLTWFRGGLTAGEQVAQRSYLVTVLIDAVPACAAFFFIGRANGDPTWRWAAWLCTGFALLTLVIR